MIRTAIIAAALASSATFAAPAFAADPAPAEAPAAKPKYSTGETSIGILLEDPAAKAIVDKHMPGFSGNPQIAMASSMTLEQVQGFAPDQIKAESIAAINADLAKLK